ncbi:MAG: hypothetical protein ACJ762_19925 [Solirubrobacteraceae bacterium]
MRRALGVVALVVVSAATAAAATFPAPSLTLQSSFSPPVGIARTDLIDQTTSTPYANAVSGDRLITVGEAGSGSSGDIGIAAHRFDGTLDPAFSDDGRVVVVIAGTEDRALDLAVLPSGAIRVLAQVGATTRIVGLTSTGAVDTSFGAADGTPDDGQIVINALTPTAIAVAGDGRLAVTGTSTNDTVVAMFNADGTPVTTFGINGFATINRSGDATPDGGADIAFRPGGGVLVLGAIGSGGTGTAFLHALNDAGADDPGFSDDGDLALAIGDAPTEPHALVVYAGRYWLTGSTRTGTDTNAFLARVEADGTGLQSRQFDMRGQLIDPATAVTSVGDSLAVVPGTPDTLVVSGSVASASGTDWAAAAFNNLGGDVNAASFGDIAISVPGSGGINSVTAGPAGSVFVAGPYQETVTTPSSSITYTRIGEAKLVIDAEKACNLTLTVPSPLELVLRPGVAGSVDVKVTNQGTRACAGAITVPPRYAMGYSGLIGPIATGSLAPGETFTAKGVALAYSGTLRRQDSVSFTVTATGDSDLTDNSGVLAVRFSYCDLGLAAAGARAFMPDEGSRRFSFVVRNRGTLACRGVRVGVGGQARPGARHPSYVLAAGRDVADTASARLRKPAEPGQRVRISFTAGSALDPDAATANNLVTLTPVVLGVGDTDARRPRGAARTLQGIARGGRGPASRKLRAVSRVSVAVRRLGGGCRWLSSAAKPRFRTVKAGAKGRCTRPVWLRAAGTTRWRLKTAGLPAGDYELLSRASIRAGLDEASFTAGDHNRVSFTVRP